MALVEPLRVVGRGPAGLGAHVRAHQVEGQRQVGAPARDPRSASGSSPAGSRAATRASSDSASPGVNTSTVSRARRPEAGQAAPAGHDRRAAGRPRQQRPHLRVVRGVVQDDEDTPPGQRLPVRAPRGRSRSCGILRARHPEQPQEAVEDGARRPRAAGRRGRRAGRRTARASNGSRRRAGARSGRPAASCPTPGIPSSATTQPDGAPPGSPASRRGRAAPPPPTGRASVASRPVKWAEVRRRACSWTRTWPAASISARTTRSACRHCATYPGSGCIARRRRPPARRPPGAGPA